MWERIKKWSGISLNSKYVKDYFEESNIRASIYMASVVILLECAMIIRTLVKYIILSDTTRSFHWILMHFYSYFVLLTAALVLLFFSSSYLKGKSKDGKFVSFIMFCFAGICLGFGMYISSVDYSNGNQILNFISMELYIMALLIWRPVISLVISVITFFLFYRLCRNITGVPFSEGDRINYYIFWIFMFMISVSQYNQKLREAEKDEELLKVNEHLEKIAREDGLTGLKNTAFFVENCERMLKDPSIRLGDKIFLFINLINFRMYNEHYGFQDGNAYLKNIAAKLSNSFEDSVLARQSDDHFLIFTDKKNVDIRLKLLNEYVKENQREIKQGIRVGAYVPTDRNIDPMLACDRARYACNESKGLPDTFYLEYDEEMHEKFHRRQYIVNNIEKAIREGWIKVFYQPMVWSESEEICGMEALARWIDPQYGLLSPGDFIPVLENIRQIHKLDRCILEQVCENIKRLNRDGNKVVPVSINFSRLDFELMNIPDLLDSVLKKNSLSKDFIHVEITESALNDSMDDLSRGMEELKKRGYSLWLDDFGAGYSSLNVLKEFNFDVIKLDMKFLKNFEEKPKSEVIIKSIINLSAELGMTTLTEGVETKRQSEFIKNIGCGRMQGYLFGKPMSLDNVLNGITAGTLKLSNRTI
ncbi:MAG: GGDEF domain-containing phosphodiesterase [Lachnospiraceae bacterium]|nr:GGDEF domain-containing phosphodiesterase [Lachnospiraceae bacterium]